MTKKELVDQFAIDARISKKYSEELINIFSATLLNALSDLVVGESLCFKNLLTLTKKEVKSRRRLHPATGKELILPAKFKIKLSTGKELDNRMNPNGTTYKHFANSEK